MGKGEHRDKDSISSEWTDINNKCHKFQEVYQRNKDNRPSGGGDVDVLTRAMDEYEKTRGVFTYYRCWELLKNSPKWASVPIMTSSSRRKAKRSKTSSSVDPETPISDARTIDLNVIVDDDEKDEELSRLPGRRKEKKGEKTFR
ncbi:putative No apical meristem-associated domain-containing protein [Helianthus annuus]|nr:putative No apical meristem-associated domain-containing protein [Helianthus annuus]KAJ0607358.1 putative No apical meristem-associated domain-containing protein [Helianthus annuus]KAJ0767413.1 putative No apical meristem-associated domain-containing protein [Helianthus annuus]KAJ0773251.1 putative No apical meristem-associated domain-containing protein [Helianthus annuus]KAJ0934833.1 putative No apical meristem-associated domain-containing protein [Helianthus annuus]